MCLQGMFRVGVFLVLLASSPTAFGGPLTNSLLPISNLISNAAASGTVPDADPLAGKASPSILEAMPVNEAVMVTAELDFGAQVPSIAEALKSVERRHHPDDKSGRVFAILDAYGGPTSDGKKLHISMHVSTEKPGIGQLFFQRTGELLWQRKVTHGDKTNTFSGKSLTILMDDGNGKTLVVDGSKNPSSILDAKLKDSSRTIREFWPDGAEREMSFIYSACGCPVKIMVRRIGEKTARAKDLPVMFPDDPAVMRVIGQLMRW